MSNVCVLKNGVALPVRTWKEKPVVSYEDIAKVHHMKTERVRLAFTRHKDELLLNEDYFDLSPEETKIYCETVNPDHKKPIHGYQRSKLFTESGYLIMACTFKGKESSLIRRTLVNNYFKQKNKSREDIHALMANGNIFDTAISVIQQMKTMQTQLDENQERVDKLEKYFDPLSDGAISLTQLAEEHGWYSLSGQPHARFASYIASICGIDIDYRNNSINEYTQCIGTLTSRGYSAMVYIRPAGLKLIDEYCKKTDNCRDLKHVLYYKRPFKGHQPGEIRQIYYTADDKHKFILADF